MSSSVQRRLGTADATVLGLAAMLGTGVFAVWAPAAAAAGSWLLLAVVLAGVVAACNVASTADLAAAHPGGGGYLYCRDRLAPGAGRLAGVAYLVGKTSSAAAAAGVFGSYVLPSQPLPAAVLMIVAVTVLNSAGVRWTARGAFALVGGTLAVLLVVVVIGLLGPETSAVGTAASPDAEAVPTRGGVLGVFTAAAFVFFAFAGYARVATLGADEVRRPDRTLRRALVLMLGIALVTYLLVAAALMVGLGTDRLATEATPLVAVVDAGEVGALGVLVRAGAAVATCSALLSVLVGVSRTALAMARQRELPARLAAICSRGTPVWADIAGGLVAIGIAVVAGPVAAIALSACAVLVYYAVINLAALRLPAGERRWPRWASALGLLLCVGLAALLPTRQVVITGIALVVGWMLCTLLSRAEPAG